MIGKLYEENTNEEYPKEIVVIFSGFEIEDLEEKVIKGMLYGNLFTNQRGELAYKDKFKFDVMIHSGQTQLDFNEEKVDLFINIEIFKKVRNKNAEEIFSFNINDTKISLKYSDQEIKALRNLNR